MTERGYFITGTGTDVGKTVVTLGLMQALQQQGHSVVAMKPVAAGCRNTAEGLRNADAEQLQAAASVPLAYEDVNPYAFEPAIAPHIGAQQAGIMIDIDRVISLFNEISARSDCCLVEGAGGWLVPLDAVHTLADLARGLDLPVILVVNLQLGCLNHALLSAAAIRASGCRLAGWVANDWPGDMAARDENIAALQDRLCCPILGQVPRLEVTDAREVARHLDVSPL